jgi:phosphate:Na+ symporter
MDALMVIGQLAGGLGLFLIAMHMMTEGLRHAAGEALRELLGAWTRTPARGLAAGTLLTAVVQSSSAVTVATIGFVNAGLLTMTQALGVVYGSNLGTTMTAWIVAVVGFKLKVEALALPLIGIGALLRLTGAETRRAGLGEAVAGFGLFFIGIDILREAFEGLAQTIDLSTLETGGTIGTALLFVLGGFVMTTLAQSSSAAIAVALTAATGGLISVPAAACVVIGANVGTTATAILSALGATPNARRVAAAHVVFNLGTGAVALLALPVVLWGVERAADVLGLEQAPAVVLALFHTTFNLLGVLMFWPLTDHLSRFLLRRFRTAEEEAGRPLYLDRTVAGTPELALGALGKEFERVRGLCAELMRAALSEHGPESLLRLRREREAIGALALAAGDFVTRSERAHISEDQAGRLALALRIAQYFNTCAELALSYAEAGRNMRPLGDTAIRSRLTQFRNRCVPPEPAAPIDLDAFERDYQALKLALLEAGAGGRIAIEQLGEDLEQISRMRRMIEQYAKGSNALSRLEFGVAGGPAAGVAPA